VAAQLLLGALEAFTGRALQPGKLKVWALLGERHLKAAMRAAPRLSPTFADACVELAKLNASVHKCVVGGQVAVG
jgi:hypothetical protein